jgi:pectinesterase
VTTRPAALLVALAAAASAAGAQPAGAPRARVALRAENALAAPRPDEVVAVPWAAVQGRLPAAAPARVRVVDAEGREAVSQVVDNDGDGRADELLFVADFRPRETRTFAVEAAAPAEKYAPRVHVRYDPPRDDVAWESDRVGFRIYGQGLWRNAQYEPLHSSGIDVWPKRTRALVVDKWYAKGHDEYHVDKGEGADFYDVGPTLGTGGTAVWSRDTLWRAENFRQWRIIADGPVRAVFELRYEPWVADGRRVSEVKRVTIDAGQNLFRSESVFEAAGAGDVPYAIGVVKRPGVVGVFSKGKPWAWLTVWGPVAPKNGGHGELGNAVLLPREQVTDWKEAHNHFLAVARATPGRPAVHYVGAGWTASGDFPTPQAWWAYLDRFAERLASPVRVAVGAAPASAAAR